MPVLAPSDDLHQSRVAHGVAPGSRSIATQFKHQALESDKFAPYSVRFARIFQTGGQAFGDLKPPLDRG